MKRSFIWVPIVIIAWVAGSCGSAGNEGNKVRHFPSPGTLMAQDSMPVTEDKLNNFMFTVRVIADSAVTSGIYDVDADYGPNFATSTFAMPKGIEDVTPILRRGDAPYTYIIGFRLPGDTTFYDYFEVSSDHHNTKMKYLKAYTF